MNLAGGECFHGRGGGGILNMWGRGGRRELRVRWDGVWEKEEGDFILM